MLTNITVLFIGNETKRDNHRKNRLILTYDHS